VWEERTTSERLSWWYIYYPPCFRQFNQPRPSSLIHFQQFSAHQTVAHTLKSRNDLRWPLTGVQPFLTMDRGIY